MRRGLLSGASGVAGTVGRVFRFRATRRAWAWPPFLGNCRVRGLVQSHSTRMGPASFLVRGSAGAGWPCRSSEPLDAHRADLLRFVCFTAFVTVRLRATRRAWRPPLSSSESSVMNTRLVVVSDKLILVTLTSWLGSCHHAALVHWSLLQTDWPPSALPGECS